MYYQFGHCLVDTNNYKIYRYKQVISDDAKSIEFLSLLGQHYPNVVEKNYLIEKLWHGQAVTDSSLSKLVSDVRKLVEPDEDNICYIKTVRGSGFRLNEKVYISPTNPLKQPVNHAKLNLIARSFERLKSLFRKPAFLLITTFAVSAIFLNAYFPASNNINQPTKIINPIIRVAVLPVKSENTPINEWIKYGVMSMTTDQLNSYSSIQTIPSSTVIAVAETIDPSISIDNDYQQYFKTLCGQIGCNHIISIQYKLDENASPVLRYHIYDHNQRTSFNHFASNDVIYATAQMLDSLVRDLLPSQGNRISLSDTYSNNTKANRDYAIGVHELLSGDPVAAMSYLQLALNKEPDFFWAKARLAEAYYQNGQLEKSSSLVEQLNQQQPSDKRDYFLQHLKSNIL
ncbi:MAG: winged helix-turn-helix domain-containing protein [Enterobacterales bacterium]|nr:winged helix-turn-helix domain-containing protein [Enterobacterales bacterium]